MSKKQHPHFPQFIYRLLASFCHRFLNFLPESIFFVQITKGPRGLGLSVSGGTDSNAAFPGLIRIKRLFPHQAAWATGMLQPGDILLAANGISLSGLTNYVSLNIYIVFKMTPIYCILFTGSVRGFKDSAEFRNADRLSTAGRTIQEAITAIRATKATY